MVDFGPVAASLRGAVTRHFADRGEPLLDLTLETNSHLVERRAQPLLGMLADAGFDGLEGVRVVDLGCGFGALACLLAARGAHVVAVDRKEDRLAVGRAVAAEHELPVEFVEGRIQVTRLPKESFDVALLNNSLCYVVPHDQRARALNETRRILSPGGRLIMRNPNRWVLRDQFTGLPFVHLAGPDRAVDLARLLGRPRSWVRLTSPRQAARELRGAGFEEIRHAALAGSERPDTLKLVSGYHHFSARRPGA